jgi:hypothetical protein
MDIHDVSPRGASTTWRSRATGWTGDGERVGVYLLVGFLAVWLITMVTIQFVMVAQHGYGLGREFGQKPHVPNEIVKRIGVGNNIETMIDKTKK